MKKDIKKALEIACIFCSVGLCWTVAFYFLLFGSGLQFALPFIMMPIFFLIFFISEKIRFLSENRYMKIIFAFVFIILFVFGYLFVL